MWFPAYINCQLGCCLREPETSPLSLVYRQIDSDKHEFIEQRTSGYSFSLQRNYPWEKKKITLIFSVSTSARDTPQSKGSYSLISIHLCRVFGQQKPQGCLSNDPDKENPLSA